VRALERIGNLASDGRPILGLDSRDLLEMALESGEGSYLIPAHIWTPWFAVLGSKSGFDSIDDCYGDLTGEIFALETGLSADPDMIRRLSQLDRYTLVSNSDAHSPSKIGRESCRFECELDYFAMRHALETGEGGDGYGGTVEFFPEEGKYHLDGHRKCGVCLSPDETRLNGGVCPVCGKALTLGTLPRISELADRGDAEPLPQQGRFRSLIALDQVLGEIENVGPRSQRVRRRYDELVTRLGPEMDLLESRPLDDVEQASSSVVAEAIRRMRAGNVIRKPGYDGVYGAIRLFDPAELDQRNEEVRFFDFLDRPLASVE
jgi:DNA helicase-2/ATP-dependent DNA helicase PcrA